MSLSDDLNSAISSADVEQNLINTVPELREFIHFDTLWQMASLIVLEHGHLKWTDTAEHDPGTTLLQAATYAIADLSYRHTHPLIDLLTPPGEDKPVFDPAFGPEKVLTVSPVTEDDYRRGIMDLCDDSGHFLFQNAQLVRESEAESYQYYYDPTDGTFTFAKDENESDPLVLLGGYTLYVDLYEVLTVDSEKRARAILDEYLIQHRNLGEQIRTTYFPKATRVIRPSIDVELDDDCQNPAQVMGMIWETVIKRFKSWPLREVEEAHPDFGESMETLYEGPNLDNGWIAKLPPGVDHTLDETFDLRKLPLELLKIDGIKQVRRLSWNAETLVWTESMPPLTFGVFWGSSPEYEMTSLDSSVRLFKRGQRQLLSKEEVKTYINWPKRTPRTSVTGPQGQSLGSLKEAIDIPGLLPDCYGLNDEIEQLNATEKEQRQRLRDYLTLFQQWVANSCKELAGLSKLLSFDQPVDAIGSGYFQDYEKGLATINYLLGYFGSQRAPRVFNKTGSDSVKDAKFFDSQRAALAQWAELGYGRANVPVNTVTAFNKRLAFRLGIGAEIFSKTPDLVKLPVYVIDYRTLLPEMPNDAFANRTVELATLATGDDEVPQLQLKFGEGALPVPGQLISLAVQTPMITILWALVVRVDAPIVYLDLSNNTVLRQKVEELIYPGVIIVCNNSDVWLRRITYPLVYVDLEQPNEDTSYRYLLHIPSSVHLFNVGDTVAIEPSNSEGLTAKVNEVNIPHGTLLVTATSEWPASINKVHWYRVEDVISDRFSLKVGVVLDRDQWLNEDRPEEVMAWVAQIVREEMPAHIQADVHWLNSYEFNDFAYNYKEWQKAAAESRLGQTSYELLKQLSLGQLPEPGRGIGFYHLITIKEEELGAEQGWYSKGDPGHWLEGNEDKVEAASIVYVPRDVE